MKYVLLLSLWAMPFWVRGEQVSPTAADPFDEVVKALRTGNVNALSQYFDNMVQITLMDQSNSYSKAQATMVLKDFFDKNPVRSFQLIHQGGQDSRFGIGKMVTANGTYRITFFLRQHNPNQYVLQEIRFEPQSE
ncbi:MAG: DUF4783 domain-containing protein [Thermoflavifilum sp.]|nr:DUF4783 domain-containing protein [Thermoflavifilum sp.]